MDFSEFSLVSNNDETARFEYKLAKWNDTCFVLNYSHSSNDPNENYVLEIGTTAHSTSAAWCEGDSEACCQEACQSSCDTGPNSEYVWANSRSCRSHGGIWTYRQWRVGCLEMPNQTPIYKSPIYNLSNPVSYSLDKTQLNGLVTDWPSVVNDCNDCNCHNDTEYIEPPIAPSSCSEDEYRTLLKIAKDEQRLGDFFAGNQGFFLWANKELVQLSHEWNNDLTGIGEQGFKRAVYSMWEDFDQALVSKENFLKGLTQSVLLYKGGDGPDDLYKSGPLTYSSDSSVGDSLLFTNDRFEVFMREVNEDVRNNIFCMGEKPILGWRKILEDFGVYVALHRGAVDQNFYRDIITGREARLLTRYMENHTRATPTDLYPVNHITFSVDQPSGYLESESWGKAIYGQTIDSSKRFEDLPEVNRRYFEGVFASKDLVTGIEEIVQTTSSRTSWFYGGLYKNPDCGKDVARKVHNIVADAASSYPHVPQSPWMLEGVGGVGKIDPSYSCFTPLFVQQPLDVVCKLGQAPTFRSLAVDYHTIPEDKVGKGYPEIDFWVNNLKLTDNKGSNIYPIEYQWYRIPMDEVSDTDSAVSLQTRAGLDTEDNERRYFSVLEWAEPASLDGNWACIEGQEGRGASDCTLFHPWESLGDGQEYQGADEDNFYTRAGLPDEQAWPSTPYKQQQKDIADGLANPIRVPTGYCNYSPVGIGLAGTFVHCQNGDGQCDPSLSPGVGNLWVSGSISMTDLYAGANATTQSYTIEKTGVKDGNSRYIAHYGQWSSPIECEGVLAPTGVGGFIENVFCQGVEPGKYGTVDEDKMLFRKGAKSDDQNYFYFAVASGRFGIRRSEYVKLETEPWLRLDFSVRNGSPSEGNISAKVFVNPWWDDDVYEEIALEPGLFANTLACPWMEEATVMPFGGVVRDPNAAWENTWRAFINMTNNCKSYAPIGMENYRGFTRTYQPPVQANTRGTRADSASYFEYGMLYPFGADLSQSVSSYTSYGDLLYGYQHLPKCEDYKMRNGRKGPRLSLYYNQFNLRNYTILDPAVIGEHNPPGLRPRQLIHHGELYPWPEMDSWRAYPEKSYGFWAMGSAWQFSNLLGKIPRFGHAVKFPEVPVNRHDKDTDGHTLHDTDDMFFWGGNTARMRENFKDAQRLIGPATLAGKNCGWCGGGQENLAAGAEAEIDEETGAVVEQNGLDGSASRFMLYFVENHQRFYISCSTNGKKNKVNYSYIAPGLRRGSSAIQFFWGGTPRNTYPKRNPLYGPYAFEWKTENNNRDRNGNGISEAFYSTKYNRNMYLYDPPAIYGLQMRQHSRIDTRVVNVKKWRKQAYGPGYSTKGLRFGRPGIKSGCGMERLHCVEEDRGGMSIPYIHPMSNLFSSGWCSNSGFSNQTSCETAGHVWNLPTEGGRDAKCNYYWSGKNLGIDPGRNYGCDNKQLAAGLCFDPCLSMKYNYGFFPGGKLLALNNYTEFKRSLNDHQTPDAGGGDKWIIQISHNDEDRDLDLSYTAVNSPVMNAIASTYSWANTWIARQGLSQSSGNTTRGYRRIMRGPWLTPYKLIRESLAENEASADLGSLKDTITRNTGDGDKFYYGDHGQRVNVGDVESSMPPWVIEPKSPAGLKDVYRRANLRKYINTEISPCNSRSADHCNYITATLHLGMDTIVVGAQNMFTRWAGLVGGTFTDSGEPSTVELVWGETGRWLMEGSRPPSSIQLKDNSIAEFSLICKYPFISKLCASEPIE